MASSTSHDSSGTTHPPLPPSQEPHSARRRHSKKKSDPFEELARTPVPSRPSSPITLPGEHEDSFLTKIILTPIFFISFILSLFLVNHRNRARRKSFHATNSSFLSYFAPSSWLDPEPYQDPEDSTWGREGPPGHVEPHDTLGPRKDASVEGTENKKPWHLHKKIRKIAKLEISDALEMRGRIITIMLIAMVLGSAAMWMASKRMFALLSNVLVSAYP